MGIQGNCALRLRPPLPQQAGARHAAREDGSTLNQFIVSAVAEKLAAMKTTNYLEQRARTGNLDAAPAFLRHEGGQPPTREDQLPAR